MESAHVEYVEVLARRLDVLELLQSEPATKPELVETLGHSRSTVDRAIRRLEEAGFVERERSGYRTTVSGRAAMNRYREFVAEQEVILESRAVLTALPTDLDLPIDVLTDARIETVDTPTQLLSTLEHHLEDATGYRALIPTLADSRHLRLCHGGAVSGDLDVELIGPRALLDRLGDEFPMLAKELVEHGDTTVFAARNTGFGLLLPEQEGIATTGILVAYEADQPVGYLILRDQEALDWAQRHYERVRSEAGEATESLASCGDSGPTVTDLGHQRLPAQLRSEGFVRVSESLDRREPVAPTTAWQAGVGLPEVAAGYTIERYRTDDDPGTGADLRPEPAVGDEKKPDEDQETDDEFASDSTIGADSSADVISTADETEQSRLTITEELLEDLQTGTELALIGPPGSGKSTVAKRVAQCWAVDHGNAYYRESGRGQPFTATGLLEELFDTATEPVLVVVEDAVRAEANAIFELMERCSHDDSVSVLVDAREGEWSDPDEFPADARLRAYRQQEVEFRRMPTLTAADCQRLIDEVNEIIDEPIDVGVETLLEEFGTAEPAGERVPPGSIYLIFARLGRIVEPLAAGEDSTLPTTLEADIDQLIDDLRDLGELALDVGVLINLLNAAECGVYPGLAYALAESDEQADRATIRAALDRLEGHVFFPSKAEGTPARTIHGTWSVNFLERLLDTDERAAAERFGRAVTNVLSLADERNRREKVCSRTGWQALAEEPQECAERICTSIFQLGLEFAQLTPLFGTSEESAIQFPDACSEKTRLECLINHGRMLYRKGKQDAAIQEFEAVETAAEAIETRAGDRIIAETNHRRAQSHIVKDEYEIASGYAQKAIEKAKGIQDSRLETRCWINHGVIQSDQMNYQSAAQCYEQALNLTQRIEDPGLEALALLMYGQSLYAPSVENLDAAIEQFERALEIYRSLSYSEGKTLAHMQLGAVWCIHPQFEHETAQRELQTALELAKRGGQRRFQSWTLYELGQLFYWFGSFGSARSQFERTLDLISTTDQRSLVKDTRIDWGVTEAFAGSLDEAAEHLSIALERSREFERWMSLNRTLEKTAVMHLLAHELDEAIENAEETLTLVEEHDLASWYQTHYALGRAQCLSGALDAARDTIARLEERAPWFDPDGSSLAAQERYFRGEFTEAVEAAWTSVNGRAVDLHGFVWPVVLARIAIAVDELGAAEENIELILEYENTPQYRYWSQLALVDRARINRQRGDLEAAVSDLEDARERAEDCGFQLAAARATLQQGAMAVDRGNFEAAGTQLDSAIQTLDELETPFYAARARFERGRCAREAGDLETAREWLTEAAEQCQEIDARYEAARVLDVLANVCEQLGDEKAAEQYREERLVPEYEFDEADLRLPESWPEDP